MTDLRELVANKRALIEQKKSAVKYADAVICGPVLITPEHFAYKMDDVTKAPNPGNPDELELALVINSCGYMDSHDDVHMKGLWNKSIQEQKSVYLLESHLRSFKDVIADDAEPSVKTVNWTTLGLNVPGSTQVLVFKVKIKRDRNPDMFRQYSNGWVKQHSVGMRYVNLFLCINSEEEYAKEEKANWDKYIDKVVNRELAEEKGYFWAVTEAKIIEGSAVLFGSNPITPVLNNKIEPSTTPVPEPGGTQAEPNEPSKSDTQESDRLIEIAKQVLLN